jgi:hypothetical protein
MDATQTDAPAAGEGVRAEVGRAMTDPAHAQHSSYQQAKRGNTTAWDAWNDSLYQKAAGKTEPLGPGGPKRSLAGSPVVIDGEGINTGDIADQARRPAPQAGEHTAPGDSNQDPLIDETHLTDEQRAGYTTAREELGDQFTSRVQAAQRGIAYLNQEPTGMDMATAWDPIINKLGRYGDAFTFEAFALLDKYMTRATKGGQP